MYGGERVWYVIKYSLVQSIENDLDTDDTVSYLVLV